MPLDRVIAQSSLSQSRIGSGLISQHMLQLTKDQVLLAVCLFSVIGLLVSLLFAISYTIPGGGQFRPDALVKVSRISPTFLEQARLVARKYR